MGKAEVRTLLVPKWATVLLWLLVAAGMVATIYALSGRAYVQERPTFAEVLTVLRRANTEPPGNIFALLAPILADVLFFLPCGALAFLALDGDGTSRARTYVATILVGAAFALVLHAWQQNLPTRVTGWPDAAWNIAGCLAGAMAGHARKRLRIRFD